LWTQLVNLTVRICKSASRVSKTNVMKTSGIKSFKVNLPL